tara:strand:+ start:1142 stop:1771 length:630 start_codon:yes stop_codon:yes gene_type:complete
MSQHDFDIANATASDARVDINLALKALGSLSSGTTEPTTRYANMLWYNTNTSLLRVRNEANDDWINVGYVDQAGGVFSIINNTKIVATTGDDRGLLGPQLGSAWTAGTSTTESLVSPAKVKASVVENVPTVTAALSVGAVGTYAFLRQTTTNTPRSAGSTLSGTSLRYTNVNGDGSPPVATPSGNWRLMGAIGTGSANETNTSLWLRIS